MLYFSGQVTQSQTEAPWPGIGPGGPRILDWPEAPRPLHKGGEEVPESEAEVGLITGLKTTGLALPALRPSGDLCFFDAGHKRLVFPSWLYHQNVQNK